MIHILLSKYKPDKFDDLPLDDRLIRKLKEIALFKGGGFYIFAEHPGVGKSQAARLIEEVATIKLDDSNVLKVNGSVNNTIDFIRDDIMPFTRGGGKRVIIVEEADKLTKEMRGSGAQEALKDPITDTLDRITWIFTTNNVSGFIDPIKSRAELLMFKPDKQKVFKLLMNINEENSLNYNNVDIQNIMNVTYPNFREAINKLSGFDGFSLKDVKSDILKLYNNKILPSSFISKYKDVELQDMLYGIKLITEHDLDNNDMYYLVLFAWKINDNKNLFSKEALIYFISELKNDNNKMKDFITKII